MDCLCLASAQGANPVHEPSNTPQWPDLATKLAHETLVIQCPNRAGRRRSCAAAVWAPNSAASSLAISLRIRLAVSPHGWVKLGSILVDIGRRAQLTDEEFAVFEQMRSKAPARAVDFE